MATVEMPEEFNKKEPPVFLFAIIMGLIVSLGLILCAVGFIAWIMIALFIFSKVPNIWGGLLAFVWLVTSYITFKFVLFWNDL